MKRMHTHSPQAAAAVQVIGLQIARARRGRRQTLDEVAERVGVSRKTLHEVEHGSPTVAIGTVFEVATLLGVPLFGAVDRSELSEIRDRLRDQLALLPARVREPVSRMDVDDDF
jgi:transcriptional regulator with XRE-family HTH domain